MIRTVLIALTFMVLHGTVAVAQEESKSKAPDPQAYSDLLGTQPSSESSVESAQKPLKNTSTLEVDRALAEASMLLGRIAEEAGEREKEMRSVFEEALDLISTRLQGLPKKPSSKDNSSEGSQAKPAVAKDTVRKDVENGPAPKEPLVTAPKITESSFIVPTAATNEAQVIAPRKGDILRWTAALRGVADELEASAERD